jgi:hypothetical protein
MKRRLKLLALSFGVGSVMNAGCLEYSPYDGGTCASGKFEDSGEGDNPLSALERSLTEDPITADGQTPTAERLKGCSVLVGSRFRLEGYEFRELADLKTVYGSLELKVSSFEDSVAEDILVGLRNLTVIETIGNKPQSKTLSVSSSREGGTESQLTLDFSVFPALSDIVPDLPALKSVDSLTINGGDSLTTIAGFNTLESVRNITIEVSNLVSITGFQSVRDVQTVTLRSASSNLGCLSLALQARWPNAKVSAYRTGTDAGAVDQCDITISAAADWAQLEGLESLNKLTINGVMEGPMKSYPLKQIRGIFLVQSTGLTNLDFLNELEVVGDDFRVLENTALATIEMPSLIEVGTQDYAFFQIASNPALQNASFPELLDLKGELLLSGIGTMTNFTAPKLKLVTGSLRVKATGVSDFILPSLGVVENGYEIRTVAFEDNANLQNIDLAGYNDCTDIRVERNPNLVEFKASKLNITTKTNDQWITFQNNDELTTIDLSGLTSTPDELIITNNGKLPNLDGFSSLTELGRGVTIQENTLLTDVLGLSGVTAIYGRIQNNPALPCTNIQQLIDATSNGGLTVSNNLNGCNL